MESHHHYYRRASSDQELLRDRIRNDYHDFARVEESQLASQIQQPHSGSAFPVRLHYVLSELEKDGDSDIISFQEHGRCFVLHNPARLLTEVLPRWFRQTKLTSFQRQLCLYGFKRITAPGPDQGGYYHECFLKGKPFLAQFIKRQRVNGRKTRRPASPGNEPNFYRMRPCSIAEGAPVAQHPANVRQNR